MYYWKLTIYNHSRISNIINIMVSRSCRFVASKTVNNLPTPKWHRLRNQTVRWWLCIILVIFNGTKATGAIRWQDSLTKVKDWCSRWFTPLVILSESLLPLLIKRTMPHTFDTLNGTPLYIVTSCKYPGLNLTENLYWTYHLLTTSTPRSRKEYVSVTVRNMWAWAWVKASLKNNIKKNSYSLVIVRSGSSPCYEIAFNRFPIIFFNFSTTVSTLMWPKLWITYLSLTTYSICYLQSALITSNISYTYLIKAITNWLICRYHSPWTSVSQSSK